MENCIESCKEDCTVVHTEVCLKDYTEVVIGTERGTEDCIKNRSGGRTESGSVGAVHDTFSRMVSI